MAFLAMALLEDEDGAARVRHPGKGTPLVGFWSVTAVVVLLLSVAAFLVLPRGEGNAEGYQEVSALPITGDPDAPAPREQPEGRASTAPANLDTTDAAPAAAGSVGEALHPGGDASQLAPGSAGDTSTLQNVLAGGTFAGSFAPGEADDVVMHVRSPVASYWRGGVFDRFDGRTWHPRRGRAETDARRVHGDPLRYTQTYFIHDPQPGVTFMGYRGVEVLSPEESLYAESLGEGLSYKVVSAQPELRPEELRRDRPGLANGEYYRLPPSMGWLREMAGQITAGAESAFDKEVAILDHLRSNARYDASAGDQLKSSASPEGFLLEGEAGTSMDFATATVLLSRAAGLPARLAVGYLPGERDLLSGAYEVRREDAHAWAEVYFRNHGWVPFDGTRRSESYAGGGAARGQLTGLKYLFESSVGDDLIRAAAMAPARLSGGIKDAFNGPLSAGLAVVAVGAIVVALGWLGIRVIGNARRRSDRGRPYARLPGEGRREVLRTYGQVERLLRKNGVPSRTPGQTLQEYAGKASERFPVVSDQLTWFTRAAWAAAYDPGWRIDDSSAGVVDEARSRLSALKLDLRRISRYGFSG